MTLDNYNKSSFNLGTILKDHEKFSSLFYDINKLDKRKKEELLKTLCLCLHHEVSSIAESSNFKIFENNSEINIFFDKKTYDLVGWQTEDIYQNLSITFISDIKSNQKIDNNIFILPKNN